MWEARLSSAGAQYRKAALGFAARQEAADVRTAAPAAHQDAAQQAGRPDLPAPDLPAPDLLVLDPRASGQPVRDRRYRVPPGSAWARLQVVEGHREPDQSQQGTGLPAMLAAAT